MNILVGSDHAGYELKKAMIPVLEKMGCFVTDMGNNSSEELVYFPDICQKVCRGLLDGKGERAVMFCGTGVGASIACNKIPGIRAAMIHDYHCAHQAVEHDHVNVMCIGGKIVGPWLAADLLKAFINAKGDIDERAEHVLALLDEMDSRISLQ